MLNVRNTIAFDQTRAGYYSGLAGWTPGVQASSRSADASVSQGQVYRPDPQSASHATRQLWIGPFGVESQR